MNILYPSFCGQLCYGHMESCNHPKNMSVYPSNIKTALRTESAKSVTLDGMLEKEALARNANPMPGKVYGFLQTKDGIVKNREYDVPGKLQWLDISNSVPTPAREWYHPAHIAFVLQQLNAAQGYTSIGLADNNYRRPEINPFKQAPSSA